MARKGGPLGQTHVASETKNLVATTIGKNGAVPGDKAVQITRSTNHIHSGTKKQVVGVAKNDFRPQGLEVLGQQAFSRIQRCQRA